MKDAYRKAHFDLLNQAPRLLTPAEKCRIADTVAMIPDDWRSVLDVGSGDGRISAVLQAQGRQITGLDWSAESLRRYPGDRCVADIRAPWPFHNHFDGIVCCEVLEHLTAPEAQQVVTQIRQHARRGFLISVPSQEDLELNRTSCPQCGRHTHLWGHLQSFRDFDAVDTLVGIPSTQRKRIGSARRRPQPLLTRLQRRLGARPFAPETRCDHCGTLIPPPTPPSPARRLLIKGLSLLNWLTRPACPRGGWFACRYGPVPQPMHITSRLLHS